MFLFSLFLQCKQDSVISSADWRLDPQELASKFNSKTKMIILNNPNNPLGKVGASNQLLVLADLFYSTNILLSVLCVKNDFMSICESPLYVLNASIKFV